MSLVHFPNYVNYDDFDVLDRNLGLVPKTSIDNDEVSTSRPFVYVCTHGGEDFYMTAPAVTLMPSDPYGV